ncbi:GPW/gp25 family protein [Desulfoluna butyratoxydans]|uniref:Gpw/gp25/anti-adapter protein irad n=1 Tax=Desulfoluna butyratoxydans TaxID=231438 RepID=A0A4U8YRG6_9BACT|nr:GPW/gp25 family protein [Desulfoluna butyratoxydans]VFQ44382.1 gpw/gp25/anti-adapter protein irad [Desulfoluna butyratoxydans]
MITGMDATTGRSITGDAHLRQSIADILSTRKGTRTMRRDYGSDVPRHVDRPLNRSTIVDIVADAAIALEKWEPRIRVERVIPSRVGGRLCLDMEFTRLIDGETITLEGIAL